MATSTASLSELDLVLEFFSQALQAALTRYMQTRHSQDLQEFLDLLDVAYPDDAVKAPILAWVNDNLSSPTGMLAPAEEQPFSARETTSADVLPVPPEKDFSKSAIKRPPSPDFLPREDDLIKRQRRGNDNDDGGG